MNCRQWNKQQAIILIPTYHLKEEVSVSHEKQVQKEKRQITSLFLRWFIQVIKRLKVCVKIENALIAFCASHHFRTPTHTHCHALVLVPWRFSALKRQFVRSLFSHSLRCMCIGNDIWARRSFNHSFDPFRLFVARDSRSVNVETSKKSVHKFRVRSHHHFKKTSFTSSNLNRKFKKSCVCQRIFRFYLFSRLKSHNLNNSEWVKS